MEYNENYGKIIDGVLNYASLLNGGLDIGNGTIVYNPQRKHFLTAGYKIIKKIYLDSNLEESVLDENLQYTIKREESPTFILLIYTPF